MTKYLPDDLLTELNKSYKFDARAYLLVCYLMTKQEVNPRLYTIGYKAN